MDGSRAARPLRMFFPALAHASIIFSVILIVPEDMEGTPKHQAIEAYFPSKAKRMKGFNLNVSLPQPLLGGCCEGPHVDGMVLLFLLNEDFSPCLRLHVSEIGKNLIQKGVGVEGPVRLMVVPRKAPRGMFSVESVGIFPDEHLTRMRVTTLFNLTFFLLRGRLSIQPCSPG